MAWTKLHTDILGDPKLIKARRQGHRNLVLLPWFLAFAKRADDGGRLSVGGQPAEPEDLVEGIPDALATPEMITVALTSCEAIGVLVRDPDGVLRFAKWEDRQAKPSDSKERVRERVKRHRQHKKVSRKMTVTPGNAGMKRDTGVTDVTPRNATEKRNPTGFLVTRGGSGAPALADAARTLSAEADDVELVEPTPEERARRSALAAEFRAAGAQ